MDKNEEKQYKDAMEKNADHIHFLKLKLMAAELRKHELEEMFSKVYNDILKENKFYAAKDVERLGAKKGDRILDERNSFLMNEADAKKYMQLFVKKAYLLGYCDTEGKYNPGFDGMKIFIDAKAELIDFMISILPKGEIKTALENNKHSYIVLEQFLEIIMGKKS